MTIGRFLRGTCMVFCLLVGFAIYLAYYVYETIDSGEIFLPLAPGEVKIIREQDTQIIHIRGESWPSIAYGQGFASA